MSAYANESKRASPTEKLDRPEDVERGSNGAYGDDVQNDKEGSILASTIQEKTLSWQQVRSTSSLPFLRPRGSGEHDRLTGLANPMYTN